MMFREAMILGITILIIAILDKFNNNNE